MRPDCVERITDSAFAEGGERLLRTALWVAVRTVYNATGSGIYDFMQDGLIQLCGLWSSFDIVAVAGTGLYEWHHREVHPAARKMHFARTHFVT